MASGRLVAAAASETVTKAGPTAVPDVARMASTAPPARTSTTRTHQPRLSEFRTSFTGVAGHRSDLDVRGQRWGCPSWWWRRSWSRTVSRERSPRPMGFPGAGVSPPGETDPLSPGGFQ
jgi:hypothetical protein